MDGIIWLNYGVMIYNTHVHCWAGFSSAHEDDHDTKNYISFIGLARRQFKHCERCSHFEMARNGLETSRGLIDRNVIGVMEGGEEADAYHKAISLSPLLISSRDQALRHAKSEGKHTLSSEQSLLIYLGN